MTKSGLADSPFFSQPTNAIIPVQSPVVQKPTEKISEEARPSDKNNFKEIKKVRYHDTMTPRHHDTVVSSNHDTTVEIVRKAVKELGKEAATHRFTVEEKKAVLDLIYSYKGSGIKTSENEVARIAINYILEDYKQNGRNSILDKVLKALNK